MRHAWIAMLMIGCYGTPDYSGAHFKCDDQHACPGGQTCIAGVCSTAMSDAPPAATGVLCNNVVCGGNQKCCADFVNGPSCVALSASCTGFAATCDGIEDCNSSPCCETGSLTIGCAATCNGATICTDASDCTGNMLCCPTLGTMEPWGRCQAACP